MTPGELQDTLLQKHLCLHFDWAREVIKLSAGALTLTVSLQSFYVKADPHAIWLLGLCWAGLALSLLFGLYVLRGETTFYHEAFEVLRSLRSGWDDKAVAQTLQTEPLAELRGRYVGSYYAMTISFATALLGLILFGILNLP